MRARRSLHSVCGLTVASWSTCAGRSMLPFVSSALHRRHAHPQRDRVHGAHPAQPFTLFFAIAPRHILESTPYASAPDSLSARAGAGGAAALPRHARAAHRGRGPARARANPRLHEDYVGRDRSGGRGPAEGGRAAPPSPAVVIPQPAGAGLGAGGGGGTDIFRPGATDIFCNKFSSLLMPHCPAIFASDADQRRPVTGLTGVPLTQLPCPFLGNPSLRPPQTPSRPPLSESESGVRVRTDTSRQPPRGHSGWMTHGRPGRVMIDGRPGGVRPSHGSRNASSVSMFPKFLGT